MYREFLTNSKELQLVVKGLTLTKKLFVSSLVVGERYCSKKSLVASIYPEARWIDGKEPIEIVKDVVEKSSEIVIYNFEKIQNLSLLDFTNKRVIAISNSIKDEKKYDKNFGFIYHIPPLRERREDIPLLVDLFLEDIKKLLDIKRRVKIDIDSLDLKENNHSLRRSILFNLLFDSFEAKDIEKILYRYFLKNLDKNSDYRENLAIFDIPLIKAGLEIYKSQLKLSEALKINRNTLRKKIYEYEIV